jgi:hypothetical protein
MPASARPVVGTDCGRACCSRRLSHKCWRIEAAAARNVELRSVGFPSYLLTSLSFLLSLFGWPPSGV